MLRGAPRVPNLRDGPWPHGHSRLFPLGRFLFSDGRYTSSERIDARSEAQNHPFHPNENVNVEVESRVIRKLLG